MANEKFYLCNNKECFTSFKCEHGILLTGCPATYYSTKEDYIEGNDNCYTIARVAGKNEDIRLEGRIRVVDECPLENEKMGYEWNEMIHDEGFKSLIKKSSKINNGE